MKRGRKPFSQQLVASVAHGKPTQKPAFVPGMKRAQFNPVRDAQRHGAAAAAVFSKKGAKP